MIASSGLNRIKSFYIAVFILICLPLAEPLRLEAQDAAKVEKKAKTRSKGDAPQEEPLNLKGEELDGKPLSKAARQKLHDEWVKRFQGAVKKLKTGKADEVGRMEELILNTREPAALGPMLEVLGRETAPIRILLDQALVNSQTDLAWVALAERLLVEPEADVRRGLVRLVGDHQGKPGYDRFLAHIKLAVTSQNPVRTGLGAMAVADLNWTDRVPDLIDQLAPVRLTRRVAWVPEPVSSGGPALSVGSVDGYVSVPVPVVGPGVVAYGQQIIPYGNGLSMGGGGSGGAPALKPVMRAGREAFPNPAVLMALVKLTEVDFGYDVASWKQWLGESFRRDEKPKKRVPTP